MNHNSHSLTQKLLLLAPLACLVSAARTAHEADVSLSLAVERGTKLTKTFASELALELKENELKVTVDGEDQEVEAPDQSMTIEAHESVELTDEYLALEDGRVKMLRRRFDALSKTLAVTKTEADGESHDMTEDGRSKLQGHTVDLTWRDEDKAWAATFAPDDKGGDDELLAELEHYADLIEFLPEGEVAIGAEWSAPPAASLHFSNPAGKLHFDMPRANEVLAPALQDELDENITGEITAKLLSVEGGLATIALVLDVETSGEVDQDSREIDEGLSAESKLRVALEFELEGKLVWNVEEGRPVSVALEGKAHFDMEHTQSSDQEGSRVVFVSTQRFTGTLRLTAKIE